MADFCIVKIKRLPRGDGLDLPSYATENAAGLDIRASEYHCIRPRERRLVKTGFALEIPHGFEVQVRPRSGLALKYGVTVLNAPGTIDEDYRGEVGVILVNHGDEPFIISRGDRIAQLVVTRVALAHIVETERLADTERGADGFGSTGVSS